MKQQYRPFLVLLAAGLTGLLFGMGLTVSEMVNPERVLGFLDIAGRWDPTLLLVMIGALLITIPGYQIVVRMTRPVVAEDFALPGKTVLDSKLFGGAALFGIGWGLVGLCPGPALAALRTLDIHVILFVMSMLGGVLAHRLLLE